jgi:hypothetical protein
MRILTRALILAASLALGLAYPAFAVDESPVFVQSFNERRVSPFPEDTDCNGELAVDVQYGFSSETDPSADVARVVARATRGSGTLRVQVTRVRLRSDLQVVDDVRISKEFLAPADPLNSGEVGNPVRLVGVSDWMDADALDDYPADPALGDDGLPSGSTFTFNTASNISARGVFGVRCTNGQGTAPSIVTGVSNPVNN